MKSLIWRAALAAPLLAALVILLGLCVEHANAEAPPSIGTTGANGVNWIACSDVGAIRLLAAAPDEPTRRELLGQLLAEPSDTGGHYRCGLIAPGAIHVLAVERVTDVDKGQGLRPAYAVQVATPLADAWVLWIDMPDDPPAPRKREIEA